MKEDTIAAQATAAGCGGVGIIRLSGDKALFIAEKITQLKPKPRYAHYATFKNHKNKIIDQGLIIYFQSPNSFTGEEVVELQGHGGQVIMDELLETTVHYGARLANPGEFSERAFLNNKIDLTQAEAICDLITAHSRKAADLAIQHLSGNFSNEIKKLQKLIIEFRVYIEAAIDFADEEINFLSEEKTKNKILAIINNLNNTLHATQKGSLLREGLQIAIIGKPNAGKSSLLNKLAGSQRALVTDIPGTTRDFLKEFIQINGIPIHIIDTAGLRKSDDMIEKAGIARALDMIEAVDHILLLVDGEKEKAIDIHHLWPKAVFQLPTNKKITLIKNKCDLSDEKPGLHQQNNQHYLIISAKTGAGIPELCDYLVSQYTTDDKSQGLYLARRRHIDALENAKAALTKAQVLLDSQQGELVAEELKYAHQHLAKITGDFTTDDLLGEIFATFCVGK